MSNTLRRLPWTDDGRTAYVTPGDGTVNRIADQMEYSACTVAADLAQQATRVARDMGASAAEMRPLLALLAASTVDVVRVAELRLERLESDA